MNHDKFVDPMVRSAKDAEFWKGVACGLIVALALCLVAFLRA